MKVSIIIPTYNEERYIGKTLQRIYEGSDDRLLEIIVVDANSPDNTETEVKKFTQVRFLNSERRCRASQMNQGVSKAMGGVFYFIHADTLVPINYLQEIENAIKMGYSHGSFSFEFDSERPIFKINNFLTRLKLSFVRGGDQTIFIMRELFIKAGGYDEKYVMMEEYDLLRKMNKLGKFCLMEGSVKVSARKYDKNSYFRVLFSNILVFSLFKMNVSPVKLKKIYNTLLN